MVKAKDPNKRSQGGKQTKCTRENTPRREEQHRGGKKQKKAQIIQWQLKHGAKENGRKKIRKDQILGWMLRVVMSKTR